MNYNNVKEQGVYEAINEGMENETNMKINSQDYYNLYGNHINCDNININNANEHIPLGTPLTYIAGNPEDPIQNVNNENMDGKKRIHTDRKYTGYFVSYVTFLIIIAFYHFYYGKYARILYGTNYNGKTCGSDLKHHKYLYFPLSPKMSKPEILNKYGKCLESCPTSDDGSKRKIDLTKDANKNTKSKGFFDDSYLFSDKNKKKVVMDKKGNTTTNVVYSDYTKSSNSNLYVEYSLNSPYYDTTNIMNICYPKDKSLREKVINIVFTNRYKTFVNLFSFHNSFYLMVIFVFITIILSFIYLLILYHIPTPSFHLFLISFLGTMICFPIYFIHKHLYLLFNPLKGSLFSYHYFISILICFTIFVHGIISLFIIFIYRNTYKYTSKLIGISLNFINTISNILYAPIIIAIISFLWFLIWVYTYIYIMTAGSLYEKRLNLELDSNGNSEIVSLQKFFYYFKTSYIFSIFWIYLYFLVCEILQSLNQFTISYLGAVWYFSDKVHFHKSINAGETMKTILDYHFGSLVLSSFINLSIKLLRVLFFWVNSTLSLPFFFNDLIYNLKERFNFILRPVSKLIDLHTMSAYCEMSMTSYPYLFACDTSSKKLINSTSPAASLHGTTYVLNIIFPCFTTMIMTFLSFNIFNNFQRYNDLFSPNFVPNPFFASFVIGILCGIITSYFITTISTLADTVLYCFICECYQKQMIDENPLKKIFTPILLRDLILDIYDEYNSNL
ncbi:inner membrane complex suture component, putative [Plasmodium gallinaceum]|uniref:Choline transporter-like protein n=1 Tax=Plasmodium gallinaceum TaxID=5849 RepID=A0A1J1GTP7_PLAGA|nr:inner membrane complex suture component, putative [Plasmodium gallinaceum]CRG95823.1 inner membrane complex suture component, putative [Plasmodium gallinaceum]